jgi:transcriptional regulator with XRE-family HTH domain
MPHKSKYILEPLNLGDETIGQRIARIRKEKELTQKELANLIGIPRSLVSNYEIGRIRLYDEMVTRFAIALEISTDYLLGLKDNPEPLPKK